MCATVSTSQPQFGRRESDPPDGALLETKVQAKLGWINKEGSLKLAAVKCLQKRGTR